MSLARWGALRDSMTGEAEAHGPWYVAGCLPRVRCMPPDVDPPLRTCSDMTKKEWADRYLMSPAAVRHMRKLLAKPTRKPAQLARPGTPAKDWRDAGKVSAVKDQARNDAADGLSLSPQLFCCWLTAPPPLSHMLRRVAAAVAGHSDR